MVRQTLYVTSQKDVAPTINVMVTDVKQYFNGVMDKMYDALEGAGEIILRHTLPFTPEETGALRESGKVYLTRRRRTNPAVEVAFGGTTPIIDRNSPDGVVDYAVFVHENMEGNFRVGGPKYLENGAKDATEEVIKYLTDKAKQAAKETGNG